MPTSQFGGGYGRVPGYGSIFNQHYGYGSHATNIGKREAERFAHILA